MAEDNFLMAVLYLHTDYFGSNFNSTRMVIVRLSEDCRTLKTLHWGCDK